MEIVLNTDERLVLRTENNHPLLNAIRRSVHEIETLAVETVEFYKNDSALYDEMLALRVGLVPLVTEKKMNAKTEVELKLNKKGPCMVYSGDLQGNAEVVQSQIPLVLLEKDQELEFIATAKLGKGITHAKHIPGLCHYRNVLHVVSKDPQVEKLVTKAKSYLKPQKHKDGWLCDLPEGVVEDIVRVDKNAISETGEILFIIESYGTMSAQEIMQHSMNMLSANLDELEEALK